MHCPTCHSTDTRVLESRQASGGSAIRRRRECGSCERRFTTFERHERGALFVRKRDRAREPFDRDKLLHGLMRAAHKRDVDPRSAELIVDRIEQEIEAAGGELEATRIGELALRGLRAIDPVAYVRFASVYRDFASLAEFEAELRRIESESPLEQDVGLFDPDRPEGDGAPVPAPDSVRPVSDVS